MNRWRISQWRNSPKTRRFIQRTQKWFKSSTKADFYIIIAWGLITWSAFQWNTRAWAASIGLYLIVDALLPVFEAAMRAKRDALQRNRDER